MCVERQSSGLAWEPWKRKWYVSLKLIFLGRRGHGSYLWTLGPGADSKESKPEFQIEVLLYVRLADLFLSSARWHKLWSKKSYFSMDLQLSYSIKNSSKGTWVAQSIKHLTLGFILGDYIRVLRWSPMLSSTLTWDSACLSPFAPPLSLINK